MVAKATQIYSFSKASISALVWSFSQPGYTTFSVLSGLPPPPSCWIIRLFEECVPQSCCPIPTCLLLLRE